MAEQLTVAADAADFIEVEASSCDVGRMIYVTALDSGSYLTVLKPVRTNGEKVVAASFEVHESEMVLFHVDMTPVSYIPIGVKHFNPMRSTLHRICPIRRQRVLT